MADIKQWHIYINVTEDERRAIEHAVVDSGCTTTEYFRRLALCDIDKRYNVHEPVESK